MTLRGQPSRFAHDAPEGEAYLFKRLSTFLRDAGHRAKYDSLDDLVDELGLGLVLIVAAAASAGPALRASRLVVREALAYE
jgi:hypothetical protein